MTPLRLLVAGLLGSAGCILTLCGCARSPSSAPNATTTAQPKQSAEPSAAQRPVGTLPAFELVGPEAGFDFQRYDDIRGQRRILEANGGGAALFDFDRDGWLDVYLTNGCRLPLRLDAQETPGALFRNFGDWRFANVSATARLLQFGYACGCAVGDYDADGFDDLFIAAYGRDALWRNQGDGTFRDVTDDTQTDVGRWSSSAAFADLNGDGHLDLYVVNYLAESDEAPKLCPQPASPDGYEQCPPAMFPGEDDALLLNDGAGRFVDASEAAGISGKNGNGLGVVVCDFDGDGRPEIYVANDGQANFLFVPEGNLVRVGPDGPSTFRYQERAMSSGVALSESGTPQASMGVAAGDYDGDGRIDLFITNFFGDTDTLYANRGGLLFDDASRRSNLGPSGRHTLGFGTLFLDADNDGWLDVFIANGHVDDRTWLRHGEPYRMRPQFYRNERNGTLTDVSDWSGDYFQREWLGRGAAAGDLDRDGRLDLVVSHQLDRSVALRNETATEYAGIVLQLVGAESNRNGYGAVVERLSPQGHVVRELVGGGSFQSAPAAEIHLGLAGLRSERLRIRWPSGVVQEAPGVAEGLWVWVEGREITRLAQVREPAVRQTP